MNPGIRLAIIPPYVELSPGAVMRILAAEIVGLQQSLRGLEDDLLVLEDISKLKPWLKRFSGTPVRRSAVLNGDGASSNLLVAGVEISAYGMCTR